VHQPGGGGEAVQLALKRVEYGIDPPSYLLLQALIDPTLT